MLSALSAGSVKPASLCNKLQLLTVAHQVHLHQTPEGSRKVSFKIWAVRITMGPPIDSRMNDNKEVWGFRVLVSACDAVSVFTLMKFIENQVL